MNEQIVSKEVIREHAFAAAEAGEPVQVNPFPEDTAAARCWSHWYWARHRELSEVEA